MCAQGCLTGRDDAKQGQLATCLVNKLYEEDSHQSAYLPRMSVLWKPRARLLEPLVLLVCFLQQAYCCWSCIPAEE